MLTPRSLHELMHTRAEQTLMVSRWDYKERSCRASMVLHDKTLCFQGLPNSISVVCDLLFGRLVPTQVVIDNEIAPTSLTKNRELIKKSVFRRFLSPRPDALAFQSIVWIEKNEVALCDRVLSPPQPTLASFFVQRHFLREKHCVRCVREDASLFGTCHAPSSFLDDDFYCPPSL